jgi:arylsulfatase A-like enzyme
MAVFMFILMLGVSLHANDKSPNVVFLFADDMGYGEIQALNPNRSRIPTPHLNQLVAEGVEFTDGHTASSVCTPSRYALLTGRYPWRTSLQKGVCTGGDHSLIAEDRFTMAHLFKQKGYATAISGKWHLNFIYDGKRNQVGTKILEGPITRGFDTWYGFHHAREMEILCKDDEVIEIINPEEMLPRTTDFAVDYISSKAEDAKNGKPFFLYVPFGSPHTPILPTKEWQGKSGIGPYGDFVMMTDGMVGRILKALDDAGLKENTIVVFSTDNGTSPRADFKDLEAKGHYPSAHLRGHKADLWDGGHRVPLIMRWPQGPMKANSKNHHLICLADFITTFAEILDVDIPEGQAEDSYSFYKSLSNPNGPSERKTIVHHSISGHFAVRQEEWKLLLAYGSGGWSKPNERMSKKAGAPKVQLYNLKNDIGEQNNLCHQYPEKVQELEKLLNDMVERGRSTPGPNLSNDYAGIELWKSEKTNNGKVKKKKVK